MADNRLPTLSELDDWELVNSDQDLRGRPLMTHSGEMVGTVRRMLVDREHERVAALILDNGRAVPVEDVEIRDGDVLIDEARDMPAGVAIPPERAASTGTEETIPIVEEELAVGKRMVERGHVRVRSRVVETPVNEQVTLREERVTIERKPADTPIADGEKLLRERDIEMVERAEEPVVEKRARVTGEVVVHKDVTERVEQIEDSVRRTEVDVDHEPDRLAAGTERDKLR